jgi:hypothetical protein
MILSKRYFVQNILIDDDMILGAQKGIVLVFQIVLIVVEIESASLLT